MIDKDIKSGMYQFTRVDYYNQKVLYMDFKSEDDEIRFIRKMEHWGWKNIAFYPYIPIEKMIIAILDIETTNFLDKGGKIVEIGIVELDLKTGGRKIVYDKVTHERPITKKEVESSWIVNNSDLTVELIQNSTELKKLQPEIQAILNSYASGVTAFNNEFDFGFLEDRGFVFKNKLPCPMKLSTNICKIPSKYGKPGYKWPNVEEAYKHFTGKTDFVEKHRGADDALHEATIVYELYKLGVFKINQ